MKVFQTTNPYSNEHLETYSLWTSRDIEHALEKSKICFQEWRNTTLLERLEQLKKVKARLEGQREIFAQKISQEMGKNIKEARAEVTKCLSLFDYLTAEAEVVFQSEQVKLAGSRYQINFEPLGTILLIMPWNFPLWQVLRVALPALVAGNCILLKPANITQGCSQLLAKAFSEELSSGLFINLVVDHEQCAKLLQDPRVSAVSMTASTKAGKQIASLAGAAMKKMVFELGGSDPYLICEDANIDLAAKACAQSRMQVSGQSCIAAKRILLRREVYSEFLQNYHEILGSLKFGDPCDALLDHGPLAHASFVEPLKKQIETLKAHGGQLLFESTAREIKFKNKDGDLYHSPHIAPQTFLMPSMVGLESLEIFAPVTMVFQCDSDEEMLELANASRYGLGAGVFSDSKERALGLAKQLQAGVVALNDFVRSSPSLPFGGMKDSGFGRELGAIGLKEFTNVKCIGSLS